MFSHLNSLKMLRRLPAIMDVLRSLDALHVSAACLGRADYLLTCDDEIIEKASYIEMIVSKKRYRLKVRNPVMYLKKQGEQEEMTTSSVATVEVPFEALAKELGSKRAIKFISEIRSCYGDSVVELKKATETLTLEQVEAEIKTLK